VAIRQRHERTPLNRTGARRGGTARGLSVRSPLLASGVRRLAIAIVLLIAAVTGSMVVSQPAMAATVPCSASALILAVSTANGTRGGGTVTLTSGCVYTLTAVNNTTDAGGVGLPVISGNVTIQGNGATITRSTASGTPVFRLFDVASAGSLTLTSLTLSNGLANNGSQGGGGIFNHGTLTISGSTFTGNSAPSSTGTSGGGINNSGTLNVTTSTFTGNSAQEGGGVFNQKTATISNDTFTSNQATIYGGGALLNAAGTMKVTGDTFTGNTGPGGGAIDNDTTLTISDSTFEGNTAGTNGGGAVENFGPTTMTQSTLSGNSSPYGADILNYTGYTISVSMSIVANGQGGPNCGGGALVTDAGYNIDTGSTCGFSSANHSMSSTQPELGALASNGGSTQTMALPTGSPAVDVIPPSTPGCTGTTDQRGITRPQGSGCDIGAYELVQSGSGQPTTPTGLTVTGVTAHSVSLSWNASSGGVTGYTVYRNGKSVGTTGGPNATTFTDVTVSPATTYQYTVDAFSGSTHSAQSQPASATTPAPSGIQAVQGGAVSTASQATSTTITLSAPVHAGDLLVGWFGQYSSSGQVQISDNVNGAWTRSSASTKYGNGGGDIALYYLQASAAAPSGLTITISASSATYLQGAAGEYGGVATSGAIDQVAAASGNSTSVDSGATGSVGAGELVVGGMLTGGSPGTVTPGSSQGQTFTIRTQTSSGSADLEDVLSSSAGAQDARATLGTATDWYAVAAVFHQYGSGNTQQPPSTPAGLKATSVTSSSVALSWNASTGGVGGLAGYTVYRNGISLGTTGGSTTTFTDSTVQPSTTYSYTVDAFDTAGNHSAQSAALQVTTPAAGSPHSNWVQGGAVSTGSRVTSVTIQLTSPVSAGALLVGWFGQYDSSGQVQVSDNVNGGWTRSVSTTYSNGGGDIALYYLQNSAAAPAGLTITITAANATYIAGALADYSGVATTGALDQAALARGNSTSVDSGPTASVGAGELVVGGILTGGSPGTVTPGSSQGQAFTLRSQTGSGSADLEDVLVSAAGAQDARATFSSASDWYAVAAVFHVASGS
jgi:chitodextrinase